MLIYRSSNFVEKAYTYDILVELKSKDKSNDFCVRSLEFMCSLLFEVEASVTIKFDFIEIKKEIL